MSLLGSTFLDQGANPPDHITGSISVPGNARYRRPSLIQVWNGAREPAQTGVGIGYHGCEWLIDFVSDRGREFSHGHDPSYVRQLCLCLAQGVFRATEIGRASCRERVENSVAEVSLEKKRKRHE